MPRRDKTQATEGLLTVFKKHGIQSGTEAWTACLAFLNEELTAKQMRKARRVVDSFAVAVTEKSRIDARHNLMTEIVNTSN